MKKQLTKFLLFLLCNIPSIFTSAQWVQTNGPYGGQINCLLTKGNELYAGGDGGVFLSNDNGISWAAINNGIVNYVFCLETDGTKVLAGAEDGVYLLSNSTFMWTKLNTGQNFTVKSICISGNLIYAGTGAGEVFFSNNNGSSWTIINSGFSGWVTSLKLIGANLFAATDGDGIFLSTNNGATWTPVNNGLNNTRITTLSVIGSNVFAGTLGSGVFLSDNNGTSWNPVNNGLNLYVNQLLINGTNLYASSYYGLYYSADNGTSWTILSNSSINSSVNCFAIIGSTFIAGTLLEGIFLSGNSGATWLPSNNGLNSSKIYSIAQNGNKLYTGTGDGVYFSNNEGSTWFSANNGIRCTSIYALTVIGVNVFAGTSNGIYLSMDDGVSWSQMNNGLTNLFVNTLVNDGTTIYVGTNGGVFKSSNNGISWSAASTGISNLGINSLTISGSKIFAGTNGGGVFLSTNGGNSWSAINNGLTNIFIYSLIANANTVYAATNGAVFSSNDNGTTWTLNNVNLPLSISSFAIDGLDIYAGDKFWSAGIYKSTLGANSWTSFSGGLRDLYIYSLIKAGTKIYAGSRGAGVWSYSINNCTLSIVANPLDQNVAAQSAVNFTFNLAGGSSNYQWQISINGGTIWTNLTNGGNSTWTTGLNTSTLTISNTTLSQNNFQYRCIASNSCPSSVTSTAGILTVTSSCVPVSITSNSGNQSVTAPSSAQFTVNVTGTTPAYQWQEKTISGTWTNLIQGATYSWTNGTSSSVLTVSSTSISQNNNQYRCIVSNSCPSSATSTSQVLSVISAPVYWIGFYTKVENNAALNWKKLIAQGTSVMSSTLPAKICADGSKATIINLNCNDITIDMRKFKFRISGASDPSLYGSFVMNPSSSTPVLAADTFQHPIIMDWAQTYRPMTLEIYNTDSPAVNIFTYPLEIYRAPVLFVHGLWGDKSTFQQMVSDFIGANMYPIYSPLIESSPLLYRLDYENSNDNSLGYNSMIVPLGINKILYQARDYNFSVGKVDLICHSMGGLLSRIYMEEIYSNQYRNDVHKFITLNTPHSGSQGANVLWNATFKPVCRFITNQFTQNWICDDAIENMRVNSFDINNLLNNSSNLNKMVGIPSYSIATTGSGFSGWCPLISISAIVGLSELTMFNNEANDLIVAVSSQYGGITPNNIFNNQCHIGSSKNTDVVNSVIALINSIPDNTNFDLTGFTPPVLTSIFKTRQIQATVGSSVDSIEIVSPSYGASIVSGGMLSCTISSTLNVDTIHFWASSGGLIYMLDTLCTGTCTFTFNVPDSLNGRLLLSVFSNDNSGNFIFDTTAVFVYPTANLDSIKLSPKSYFISTNEIVPVNVYGHYNDGISRNITHNPGVNFQILDTTLAWIAGNNEIQGKDTGTTQLIAYYQGFSDTLDLIVYLGEPWLLTTVDNNMDYTSNFIDNSRFLNIYPNPTNKNIFVKIVEPNSVTFELSIVDMLGNIMYKKEYINNLIDFETDIDISNFAMGVYLIYVSSEQKKYFGKVIKN